MSCPKLKHMLMNWCRLVQIFKIFLISIFKKKKTSSNQNSITICEHTTGHARLKSPGSIWGAPIPVLTNRKYLPIMDKKCALDRLGRSNRPQPIGLHNVSYKGYPVMLEYAGRNIHLALTDRLIKSWS